MNGDVDKQTKHAVITGKIARLRDAVRALQGLSDEVCNPRPKDASGKDSAETAESLEEFLNQSPAVIDGIIGDLQNIESGLREALL